MKKFENWTIAYRKRNDGSTLIDNLSSPFTVIKNDWRYWRADPHLFEKNGHTYMFAEMYDRILRRGVIGCCELTDSGATPWKVVLSTPFHLSYPHVFEWNEDIYMIPESYVAEEIALYRAVNFPEKWEKTKVLKADFIAVDSTLVHEGVNQYLLTLQFKGEHEQLVIFSMNDLFVSAESKVISIDDSNRRPAGRCFLYNEKLIRPAQDCSAGYGCAINFYEIEKIGLEEYQEKLLLKLYPDQVQSDLTVKPEGIHTYNCLDNYEVIDLKGYEKDYFYPIMRIIWGIKRRLIK